jgi:hypothetical protein
MDNKKMSEEIINSLTNQTCHQNLNCETLKVKFLNNCKYNKNQNITLNFINKNVFCIKLYNEYYDCYKNDKLSKK